MTVAEKFKSWGIVAVAASGLVGCVTYGDWVTLMEREIAAGRPDQARIIIERRGTSGRDAVLYLLNKAMLARMSGDFGASNNAFEAVKPLIDRLSAISVTEQAGALTINDTMRSYVGAPFERAFIHFFEVLNLIALNRMDGARVEILQLDVTLNGLVAEGYPDLAFGRYLSGMVFEGLGEWDDALIAYRKTLEAYRAYPPSLRLEVPEYLQTDLIRMAERVGLHDEARLYREEFGGLPLAPGSRKAKHGQVVFLLQSGLAPVKREAATGAVAEGGEMITISMPYFLSRRPLIEQGEIIVDGASAQTQLMENIESLAMYNLDREKPAILARAIARAAVKLKASKEAEKRDAALGFMVNVAGVISERADTRSWSTLPNRLYIARVAVAEGRHDLEVALRDAAGRERSRLSLGPIDIKAGEIQFVALHKVLAEDLQASRSLAAQRRGH